MRSARPGDTLLTAIVCRHIVEHYPGIQINCITPNPSLIKEDPHIHRLNGPETYVSLRHWYLELIEHKQGTINVLAESMRSLGNRRLMITAHCLPDAGGKGGRTGAVGWNDKTDHQCQYAEQGTGKELARRAMAGAGGITPKGL